MPSVSNAQQHYFGAIKGGAIPKPKGMTDKVVDEFARTSTKGLPGHVMADGGKTMASNTIWGQKEPSRHLADGKKSDANWMERAFRKNRGGLHRATGTPEGQKIPAAKMTKAEDSSSLHVRRMAQAAENARGSRRNYKQ